MQMNYILSFESPTLFLKNVPEEAHSIKSMWSLAFFERWLKICIFCNLRCKCPIRTSTTTDSLSPDSTYLGWWTGVSNYKIYDIVALTESTSSYEWHFECCVPLSCWSLNTSWSFCCNVPTNNAHIRPTFLICWCRAVFCNVLHLSETYRK